MEDLGTSDYRDVIEIIAVKDDRYWRYRSIEGKELQERPDVWNIGQPVFS